MNTFRTAIIGFLVFCASFMQAQETLTNQSVLDLLKLGLGESIIISKIKTSNNAFDMATAQLIVLKTAGATDGIITTMMDVSTDATKKVVDMNDYRSPHRPGIYYYNAEGRFVELLPTVTSANKTRNTLGAMYSVGLSKAKFVSQVPSTAARTRFKHVPKFYFYFKQQDASFDQNSTSYYGFSTASSPNEFLLAQMDVRRDTREILVGSGNNYTREMGLDEKQMRPFNMKQLQEGVFEVNVVVSATGEYCFVYSGAAPAGGGQQKLYDFGIE